MVKEAQAERDELLTKIRQLEKAVSTPKCSHDCIVLVLSCKCNYWVKCYRVDYIFQQFLHSGSSSISESEEFKEAILQVNTFKIVPLTPITGELFPCTGRGPYQTGNRDTVGGKTG